MRKYYDASFHGELNIDANVKYIPNATTEKLNDQVTVLKYPFLPGGHEPQSIEHIVSNFQTECNPLGWLCAQRY